MPTVYNLQHANHVDRETGVRFHPVANPFVVREDEDEIGRVTPYIAHSKADVEDEDHLEHFRGRRHMYHIEEDGGSPEPPAGAQYEVEERESDEGDGTGWYDVVGPDGEVENENALREGDARELADHLNEQVG